jgi:uncharacterized membrane protein YbhN (UPF0104 family)
MKWFGWYAKIGLTVGALAWLMHWLVPAKLLETLQEGDGGALAIGISLVPLFICLKSSKWHVMAKHAGATEDFRTSCRAVLVGLGFGIFTPGRAGELMRAKPYASVSKVTLAGLVVVDRLIDLITVVCLSALFFVDRVHPILLWTAFGANVLALFSLKFVLQVHRLLPAGWGGHRLNETLSKIGAGSVALTPRRVMTYAAISFVIWFVVIIQFHFFLNMYQRCDFAVALITMPVIQFTNLLPVTIGGLGVREALSVYVLAPFGVQEPVAAIAALSIFVFDIALPGLIGLGLFALARRR